MFLTFNEKRAQVKAYIFSTSVVTTSDPQYTGTSGHVGSPFTWTHTISITQNCLASFIVLKEQDPDSAAQLSSKLSAKERIQTDSLKKKIVLMEVANKFDN